MNLCAQMGFATVALTDHDTMCGLSAAQQRAQALGMRFIPGVEISAGGCPEVHILGYGVDSGCTQLRSLFAQMRALRRARVEQFIEKLNEQNVHITYQDVLADAGSDHAVGRPHIGRALVRLGYARDLSEAFSKYLVRGAKTFVEREKISVAQAIRAVNEAGGVAVLAHPGLLRYDMRTLENVVRYMRGLGLCGMECYHSRHDRASAAAYRRMAERLDLLVTGGSDFHGGVVKSGMPLPQPGDGQSWFSDADACADLLTDAIARRKKQVRNID